MTLVILVRTTFGNTVVPPTRGTSREVKMAVIGYFAAPICRLSLKCPSDEGTPSMQGHFCRCPLVRGTTVVYKLHS